MMGNNWNKEQQEIRKEINALFDRFDYLFWNLDEGNAGVKDWLLAVYLKNKQDHELVMRSFREMRIQLDKVISQLIKE